MMAQDEWETETIEKENKKINAWERFKLAIAERCREIGQFPIERQREAIKLIGTSASKTPFRLVS